MISISKPSQEHFSSQSLKIVLVNLSPATWLAASVDSLRSPRRCPRSHPGASFSKGCARAASDLVGFWSSWRLSQQVDVMPSERPWVREHEKEAVEIQETKRIPLHWSSDVLDYQGFFWFSFEKCTSPNRILPNFLKTTFQILKVFSVTTDCLPKPKAINCRRGLFDCFIERKRPFAPAFHLRRPGEIGSPLT